MTEVVSSSLCLSSEMRRRHVSCCPCSWFGVEECLLAVSLGSLHPSSLTNVSSLLYALLLAYPGMSVK